MNENLSVRAILVSLFFIRPLFDGCCVLRAVIIAGDKAPELISASLARAGCDLRFHSLIWDALDAFYSTFEML